MALEKINHEKSEEMWIKSLLGSPPPSHLDWRGSCAWGMSMGAARKLIFHYVQLVEAKDQPVKNSIKKIGESIQEILLFCHVNKVERPKLQSKIVELVGFILESCQEFGKDPCLCLFLWRRHTELDQIMGFGFTADYFKTLFSSELDKAYYYLSTSFAKKGYTHLLPIIEEKYMAMKACQLLNS